MNCKNCNTPLSIYATNYCLHCGARVIKNRLTFKGLVEQAGEEFFNIENKPLRTFIHLFTKPKAVIDGYINGTRKKYVNPISFIAISLAFSAIQFFIINTFFNDFINNPNIQSTQNTNANSIIEQVRSSMSFAGDYSSIIIFITIPVMALISYIVFINYRKYNFVEHTVIYLYTYSVTTILGFLVTIALFLLKNIIDNSLIWVSLLTIPTMLSYNSYVLKKLFDLKWITLIWKTFLFIIIGTAVYLIISIVLGIILGIYIQLGGPLPEYIQEVMNNAETISNTSNTLIPQTPKTN
ncbi:DUF3667 domain-containing protein [Flavobacteriaceae bacterium AU392]|nr:DUF3667 domain-containing protein [Flavobacteriaceae bacterium]RKM81273.1 DUF3667 domain-containing protein [Flavobacteriaceae bacterium AU392]